jgi:RNA polymerase sigma factor (sigma-70 family)
VDVNDGADLAEAFESHRAHLRGVAYRMLGSLAEADDIVQEAWLRLQRVDADEIQNLAGWLTTVVARLCLTQLRTRTRRREDPLEIHMADPVVTQLHAGDPELEAMVADRVGLALQVVLEALNPAERVAFVLHDLFAVPFDEIAELIDRTPVATRQLASRARRRVQDTVTTPDVDLTEQRRLVDAFFAASRDGDLEGLVAVLDPNVVLRTDGGRGRPAATSLVRGATAVAERTLQFRAGARWARPVVVNGVAGVVVAPQGRPVAVMAFTVAGGRIVAIDGVTDPERLAQLDLGA